MQQYELPYSRLISGRIVAVEMVGWMHPHLEAPQYYKNTTDIHNELQYYSILPNLPLEAEVRLQSNLQAKEVIQ